MTKRFRTGILATALALGAIACGTGNADQGAEDGSARGTTQPAGPGAADDGGGAAGVQARGQGGVNITVSRGPAAGTHDVNGETLCVFANGTWIASYSDYPKLETQAVIYDVGRDGGTSQNLQYTAVFGDPGDESDPGTMLTVAPQMATGLEATIALGGGTGEVRLQGVLEDGNRISARFSCTEVER
jgi:hypothetical protein